VHTAATRRHLRERQRQEREDLILQAAEEVLTAKGYHDTSMDEIAARVGIAKGTVYLHFSSKEDLVFALFERDMQKFIQVVEATIASTLSAQAKLGSILHYMYGELFSKRFQLLYALHDSAVSQTIFDPKKAYLHSLWERLTTSITALLEEGKRVGEFDPTIPTVVLLATFFSLISPHAYKRLADEEQMSSDELVKHLERFYFKGIAAKDRAG